MKKKEKEKGDIDHFLNLLPEEDMLTQITLTNEMIWRHNFKRPKIEKWLNNFTGEVYDKRYEQRIALWILLNYVYYNETEVRHLCKTLFKKFVHSQLIKEKENLGGDIQTTLFNLLNNVRFSYLGQPSESGAYMLYYFRQENNLSIDYFPKKNEALSKNVDTIIFIDDVTLSGSQADKYIDRDNSVYENIQNYMLLTLISTDKAIERIKESDMNVISCIQLNDSNKCFSSDSLIFNNMEEHIDKGKKIMKEYGKRLWPRHPLGYKKGEYAFGFFYNTPDNTLPVFWSHNNGWNPIMTRHIKIERRKDYGFGRFV